MEQELANSFVWAWGVYLLGAFGLLLAAWLLVRRSSPDWRHLLVVSTATLVLTPTPLPGMEEMVLVPALFVLVFGTWFEGGAGVLEAGLTLLGVWLVGLVLSLGVQLLRRPSRD